MISDTAITEKNKNVVKDYLIEQFRIQFPKDFRKYTYFIFENDDMILDIDTDEGKEIYQRLLIFKSFYNKASIEISTDLFINYKNINKYGFFPKQNKLTLSAGFQNIILNYEKVFDNNDDNLIIDIIFMVVYLTYGSRKLTIPKSDLITLLADLLETRIRSYINNLNPPQTADFDMQMFFFKDFNTSSDFLLHPRLISELSPKTTTTTKRNKDAGFEYISTSGTVDKKTNKKTVPTYERFVNLNLNNKSIILKRILKKLALYYYSILENLENQSGNLAFESGTFFVQNPENKDSTKGKIKFSRPVTKIIVSAVNEKYNNKTKISLLNYIRVKEHSFENIIWDQSLRQSKNKLKLLNPNFDNLSSVEQMRFFKNFVKVSNDSPTLEIKPNWLSYKVSVVKNRPVVSNNGSSVSITQKINPFIDNFVKYVDATNNVKYNIDKEHLTILKKILMDHTHFKSFFEINEDPRIWLIKHVENLKVLSLKEEALVVTNYVFKDFLTLDNIFYNIGLVLGDLKKYIYKKIDKKLKDTTKHTTKIRGGKSGKKPNWSRTDSLNSLDLKQKLEWVKSINTRSDIFKIVLEIEDTQKKIQQIKTYIDTCDVIVSCKIFKSGYYLSHILCFRARCYALSNLSFDKNSIIRWLPYINNDNLKSFTDAIPEVTDLNRTHKTSIELFKEIDYFMMFIKKIIYLIYPNSNVPENIDLFFKKNENYKYSYIFNKNLTKEDLDSVAVLNICISIAFNFYKKNSPNGLHNQSYEGIFLYAYNKLEAVKSFNNFEEVYAFFINDFTDLELYGVIYDFFGYIKFNKEIKAITGIDSRFSGIVFLSLLLNLRDVNNYKYFNIVKSGFLYDPYMCFYGFLKNRLLKKKNNIIISEFFERKFEFTRPLIKSWLMTLIYGAGLRNWWDELYASRIYKNLTSENDKKLLVDITKILYKEAELFLIDSCCIDYNLIRPRDDLVKIPKKPKYVNEGLKDKKNTRKKIIPVITHRAAEELKRIDNLHNQLNMVLEKYGLNDKPSVLKKVLKLIETRKRNLSVLKIDSDYTNIWYKFYSDISRVLDVIEGVDGLLFSINYHLKKFLKNTDKNYLEINGFTRTTLDFFTVDFAYLKKIDIKIWNFPIIFEENLIQGKKLKAIIKKIIKLKKMNQSYNTDINYILKFLQKRVSKIAALPSRSIALEPWNKIIDKLDIILDINNKTEFLKELAILKTEVSTNRFLLNDTIPIVKVQILTNSINNAKTRTAFSPNLIHSLDSEILRQIIYAGGPRSVNLHDCFKIHASNKDLILYYYNISLFKTMVSPTNRDNIFTFLEKYTNIKRVESNIEYKDIINNISSLI